MSADILERFPTVVGEPFLRRSALGLRFRDAQTDAVVTDPLRVEARPVADEETVRVGVRGPSGVVSFHELPGLRGFEWPDRGLEPPAAESRPFGVAVWDPAGRFLAHGLLVALPREQPLLLQVPLFASPVYPPHPGWAVLRGRVAVWSGSGEPPDARDAPAAFARLRAEVDGAGEVVAVSDQRGEFLLTFPLPPLLEIPAEADEEEGEGGAGGEEPLGGPGGLETRSWTVEVQVAWEPEARTPVPGSEAPDLSSIHGQGARSVVTAWPLEGNATVAASWTGAVRFGATTKIETEGREALWIRAPEQP